MNGTSTYDVLVIVGVIYDMAWSQRDYLISMFNASKGYYDRARPVLNTIIKRRMGLTIDVVVCHVIALRTMKHHIKTGFGIPE